MNRNKSIIWIVMLFLFSIACNDGQEEKDKKFQVRYDPDNKKLVRDSMEALIESEEKMYEKTDSIEDYFIFWLKIKEIDTGYAKQRINTIRSVTEYIRENDIPGVPDRKNKDAILKALEVHDDSLINFYKKFHGYKVKYNTRLLLRDDFGDFATTLWVDTNANIKLEAYPEIIPLVIIGDSVSKPTHISKKLIKRWWPDTLPKHIDTMFLSKEIRENAKFIE